MSRESIYNRYSQEFPPDDGDNGPAYWFIFNQDKMLLNVVNNKIKVPYVKLAELNVSPVRTQYLGRLQEVPVTLLSFSLKQVRLKERFSGI